MERAAVMLEHLKENMSGQATNVVVLPRFNYPGEEAVIIIGCTFSEGFIACEFPEEMYLSMHPKMFARVIVPDLEYGIQEARRARA